MAKVNLSAFVYRVFHEDFSPIIGTNLSYICITEIRHFSMWLFSFASDKYVIYTVKNNWSGEKITMLILISSR